MWNPVDFLIFTPIDSNTYMTAVAGIKDASFRVKSANLRVLLPDESGQAVPGDEGASVFIIRLINFRPSRRSAWINIESQDVN